MGTRFLAKGISALMLAVAFFAVSVGWAVAQDAEYVPGRVLVMFQPGVVELPLGSEEASIEDVTMSSDSLQILTDRFGIEELEKVFKRSSPGDTLALSVEGKLVKVDDLSQVYKLFLPDTSNIPLVAQALSNLPGVVYAEPDYIGHLQSNDPYFGQQWGLEQDNDWDIDAPQAWELTTGNNNVLIGLLDSGIDYNHDDLGGAGGWPNAKVTSGYDYVNDDSDPVDDYGHGTGIAGIIGALTNNSIGIAGIAGGWNGDPVGCKLMPVKIAGADGGYSTSDLVAGFYYASTYPHLAKVINFSGQGDDHTETLRTAVHNAFVKGCATSVAMGKAWRGESPWGLTYPAAYADMAISVGAMNSEGEVVDFANNYFWSSRFGDHIDVVAPAWSWTTELGGDYSNEDEGTSVSTAFVSGEIGLILSYKSLTNEDVEGLVRAATKYVRNQSAEWTPGCGTGLIKARKALDLLQPPNTLFHWTTTGGSGQDDEETFYYGGSYYYRRYKVTYQVTYPMDFQSKPYVWTRSRSSTGRVGDPNLSYQIDWTYATIVPGSATETGCTFQSYVYDVRNALGQHVDWYPCPPQDVTWAYTALGVISPRTFVDDCGDPDNEPHLIRGEDYSFPGGSEDPCKTVSKDPSQVIYRYTNLIPANTYKVYVDYYWEEEDKLDPPVRLTLWADSQKLHDAHIVYPGECDCLGPYTVNGSEYADGSFDLKVLNHSGRYAAVSYITVVEEIEVGTQQPTQANHLPQDFELSQNYPNPFNSSTLIRYTIPAVSDQQSVVSHQLAADGGRPTAVTLRVYNIAGQKVRTLVNSQKEAGSYRVCWNGKDDGGEPVASGVYIYRIQAGDFAHSRRMLLLR